MRNYFQILLAAVLVALASQGETLDVLTFGQVLPEREHALRDAAGTSAARPGGGRVLLPPRSGWEGSRIAFRMKVRPSGVNYVTVRFPAAEVNENLLFLFIGGKQIGYRPIGDYDALCTGNDEPVPLAGSFYQTMPLPEALTAGRNSVELGIGMTGPIWPYGRTFEFYQRACGKPSRTLLATAVHTEPFAPARDLGEAVPFKAAPPKVRPDGPGQKVMDRVRERVNRGLKSILRRPGKSWNQMEAFLIARAYSVPWTLACRKAPVPHALAEAIDAHYLRYRVNPAFLHSDTSTWNSEWYGFGVLGASAALLAKELAPMLDERIPDGAGGRIIRRAAWDALFGDSLAYLRTHRRQYTNQAMINDLNLYRSNRGLLAIGSPRALSEAAARAYLYEACGLSPWLGSDDAAGKRLCPLGDDFYEVTPAGLSRELGYVGNYGEMLNWMAEIVAATRDASGRADPRLAEQFAKLANARAPFRYPSADADGFRAMRLETAVGWRDIKSMGDVLYLQRGPALDAAALTRDPALIGFARQEFADNQFYCRVASALEGSGLRLNHSLLDLPQECEWLLAQPDPGRRLPMTPGQPDFVFADLDDGVMAVKDGETRLYVSLYWRALFGVNRLGKVHYLAPGRDYRATVAEDVRFEDSGRRAKRPRSTDASYGMHAFKEYDSISSAHTGEAMPVAQIPSDAKGSDHVGRGNLFAGRCELYHLNYGDYSFIMNSGTTKAQTVTLPAGTYRDLATGAAVSGTVTARPRTSCILKKQNGKDGQP